MKLGLGTVQFGLPYGVTNSAGQTPPDEVRRILDIARGAGVSILDTAAMYGNSEQVLGDVLADAAPFRLVTKTIPLPTIDRAGVEAVVAGFRASLDRLSRARVHGLLVHRQDDLAGPVGTLLFEALQECRAEGWVERLGVSVYSPMDALQLAERFPLDIVQLPFNILDQRAVTSGALDELAAKGIGVHARSIFLQGILANPSAALARGLATHAQPLARFAAFAAEYGMTPLEAALGFVRNQPIEAAIVGVTSAAELKDIVAAYSAGAATTSLPWEQLAVGNLDIIDPRRWCL